MTICCCCCCCIIWGGGPCVWVGWPGPCECPCDMIGDEREGGKDEDEEWGRESWMC